ncbi:MAG: deoxyribonuclease IV [Planctomycetes bacterium]|nr:deoxyribonuclease IV [Planctomycetota bacterium]
MLGAHMSIAGGLHLACERAAAVGCEAMQIFTKNERQWRARPITDEEAARFRASVAANRLRVAFAHDTYLHNLASPDDALWRKSVDAFTEELERCERLGLAFLVSHPGSPGTAGADVGVRRMRRALAEIGRRTRGFSVRIALETPAGQGACLGRTFEDLAAIADGADDVRFCFDTCHVFAAGYDLRTRAGYDGALEQFDRHIGLSRLVAFHVNDSKKGLGSRVDRHAHIGQGCLGLEPFAFLMNDPRFETTPKVLETPKEGDMDAVNLATLRNLRPSLSSPCAK